MSERNCSSARFCIDFHIALQALVRRDELEPESRVALFENIGAHFKSIVSFPADAIDGISDEQYIRNVVDALYRNQ